MTFQLGSHELDGPRSFVVEVATAEKIAKNRNVATDFAAWNQERFHDNRSLIIDLAQRSENLRPWHPTTPWRTAIRFSQVEMTKPVSSFNEAPSETVFLDVHVESVQKE